MVKASCSKKAGSSSSHTSDSATAPPLKQVKALQSALVSSSDLNPLSELLTLSKQLANVGDDRPANERKDAAVAVHRALVVLVKSIKSLSAEDRIPFDKDVDQDGYILSYGAKASNNATASSENAKQAQAKVTDWLRMRWNETIELLCGLLGHPVESLRLEALQMLMDLQTTASSSLTRISAASAAAKTQAKITSASNKDSPESVQATSALWSASPWRALSLALIAGPPSLLKLGSGDAGTRYTVVRVHSGVPEDVRNQFVQIGLHKHDDVRFATLREISHALRKPSPSFAGSTLLRAHTLALLIQLTAIPTTSDDLNQFLVDELSTPPLGAAGTKKMKKKKSAGGGIANDENRAVIDDGDSEAEEEQEDDMTGWFSDSDEERGAQAGATAGEQRRAADKKAVGGLGSAARSAAARKRRQKTFHQALHSIGAQRSAFSAAWLDVLLPRRQTADSAAAAGVAKGSIVGGDLSLVATHEVLVRLHAQILPHLTKPTMLHDFLVSCLDSSGATALLALNAIFTLVTKHNLDYPHFYNRLYAMLDASVLHMKYRARFLRLLETFLSSTHLSSTLVASFVKRLSRLSLRAPPAAIASVVPFVYNLLKKHPRCLSMVHKEWDGDRLNIGPAGVSDPFNAHESDPLLTHALDSSLWELASFGAAAAARGNSGGPAMRGDQVSNLAGEAHFLGSVTSLAHILAEPFTRERYSLDDFLDITYATLFETETRKTLNKPQDGRKRAPALAYSLPGGFGAGGSTDTRAHNRVDIFPSESGRTRAKHSLAEAQSEEEKEIERERAERKRRLGEVGGEHDEEDDEEREAREAIEELKRTERAKKRKVDQTGTHDVCATLFSFA